ncbi:subtilisin-like serine protease-like protein PR1A [Amniculicola lignicola CBS 123094]|uniref:Subtilisin-like serine protease-like protein PR1A n=1 Tax=Amniculicola lignicola CBS 123094 TaxID=1392246 RepID=A0A6A5WJ50_9PLEO|nr:subtilisin-like serine protease-like protein PR1A [Amniculicola lignicola CBS 123094]
MQLSLLFALLPVVLAAPPIQPGDGVPIKDQYVVVLKSDLVGASLMQAQKMVTTGVIQTFDVGTFKGFSAKISKDALAQIKKLDSVAYVEQDKIITVNFEAEKSAYKNQTGAPWGLARISSRTKGKTNYLYHESAGAGTCSYVIDTGIDVTHTNFQGRATWLSNHAGDGSNTDGNGHGTHCAGTIGSKTYGVAKKTKLYAVKVLNAAGSGTLSGVIAGINFAANDAQTRDCPNGTFANLSLGGAKSDALNAAAAAAVNSGLFLGVAAGNSATDAKDFSPASEPTVFTVGATDIVDEMAWFSNFGAIVDAFAPGVDVLSTWPGNTTNTISGTSMATPHLVGLAAYLSTLEGKRTPANLTSRIRNLCHRRILTGIPSGTTNRLIFNRTPYAK